MMVLVSACASEAGQVDESESFTCSPKDDELVGCCGAGTACTWSAPVGASCTDAFTSFCGHGAGWCEDSVCRSFCSPVDLPRCADGLAERHGPIAELGDADQCLCVPE